MGSRAAGVAHNHDDAELQPLAGLRLRCALLEALHAQKADLGCSRCWPRLRSWVAPAMARASMVFPVPGGPTSRTPLGSLPPRVVNLWGSRRYCTTSSSSPCTHGRRLVVGCTTEAKAYW